MSTQRSTGVKVAPPLYLDLRMTIPAQEAVIGGVNAVAEMSWPEGGSGPRYAVCLAGKVPSGLVLCLIGHQDEQHRGLRMEGEPQYPGEWRDGIAWHEQGDWVPCPHRRCARALIWYEAGYVPGYRICTAGHHAQLSEDGRTARAVRMG